MTLSENQLVPFLGQRVTPFEKEAITAFFINVTVPILFEKDAKIGIAGTGTLFKIAGRSFLIGSRHASVDIDPAMWAFPVTPMKGPLQLFGRIEISRPEEEHLDIVVIELLEPAVIEILDRSWRFMTLANVARVESSEWFVLCGYPVERAKAGDGWAKGGMVLAASKRLARTPTEAKKPITKGIDYFFDFETAINDATGEAIRNLDLEGASGCSIWGFQPNGWNPKAVWDPTNLFKVTAIQATSRQNDFFRGKNWSIVANALYKIDTEMASALSPLIQRKTTTRPKQPIRSRRSSSVTRRTPKNKK